MTKPPDTFKVSPANDYEPLYEAHGNEEMPQPREEGGEVVYYNDPGEEEFFTRSRINGRFVKNARNALSNS